MESGHDDVGRRAFRGKVAQGLGLGSPLMSTDSRHTRINSAVGSIGPSAVEVYKAEALA